MRIAWRGGSLGRFLLGGSLGVVLLGTAASADTLRDALRSAYQTNPSLNAQRQTLNEVDSSVALALSQARPQVSAIIGVNRDLTRSGVLVSQQSKGPILSGGLDLNLPIFLGGRVRNSVEAARARVEAGRASLRAVEASVFADVVEIYMNVMRDRAILELNENQVRVLGENLSATTGLFKAGDLTRTDIAQSEARLSAARGQLATAQARLTGSEEDYLRIVGARPDDLASPPVLPPLPSSANEAVRIAMARNPNLTSALQLARAAGLDVRTARADRLPTLSGVVGSDYVDYLGQNNGIGIPRSGTQTTVGLTSRIPLYQGGAPAARIRQAQAAQGRLMEQTIAAERSVVARARSAYADYEAAKRTIATAQIEVEANELALRGARAERRVGTRTVIEVLNAEQELLNSQVRLISARRDTYVAGFRLLEAMGMANAGDLSLEGGPLYDPLGNYRRVAGNWNDWANDADSVVRSTPTQKLAEATPERNRDVQFADAQSAIPPMPVRPVQTAVAGSPGETLVKEKPVTAAVHHLEAKPPLSAQRGPATARNDVLPKSAAPAGKWSIQLGAFRTHGAPQAQFARLSGLLGDKRATYLRAGDVTRLLVGPYDSRGDAQKACSRLASNTGCFVLAKN